MQTEQSTPLVDLEWTALYDYINVASKEEISKRINNFFESFYPLKYKSSGNKQIIFKSLKREGLLGQIALAVSKILYSLQLFLASQLEICLDEDKQMKDVIRISQIFVQIQKHYLEDSMRMEQVMNMVNEIAWEITKTNKDNKIFLETKMMTILQRILEFCEWFRKGYRGDSDALDMLYKLLHRIILNVKHQFMQQISLYKEIELVVNSHLKFFSGQKSFEPRKFSQELQNSLQAICSKQKRLIILLGQASMTKALNYLGQSVPKDLVQNYGSSEIEINNLISEEQQQVEPIILAERVRNTSQWRKKVTEQMINVTVQKLVKNPPKILLMEDFKKSNGFPLFQL